MLNKLEMVKEIMLTIEGALLENPNCAPEDLEDFIYEMLPTVYEGDIDQVLNLLRS